MFNPRASAILLSYLFLRNDTIEATVTQNELFKITHQKKLTPVMLKHLDTELRELGLTLVRIDGGRWYMTAIEELKGACPIDTEGLVDQIMRMQHTSQALQDMEAQVVARYRRA